VLHRCIKTKHRSVWGKNQKRRGGGQNRFDFSLGGGPAKKGGNTIPQYL